jgi:DNA-binding winged helix-turn-helix (wHTH) protein
MSNSNRRLYEFEDFRLDPAERLLVRAGAPVPLAPKAFEMLVVLVSNSGRLLTKDELLRAIWADVVVEENNLDKHISALRKALGESSAEPKFIETVRGHGYRFNALVNEIVAAPNNGTAQVVIEAQLDPITRAMTLQLADIAKIDPAQLPLQVKLRDEKFGLQAWQNWSVPILLIVLLLGGAVIFWAGSAVFASLTRRAR